MSRVTQGLGLLLVVSGVTIIALNHRLDATQDKLAAERESIRLQRIAADQAKEATERRWKKLYEGAADEAKQKLERAAADAARERGARERLRNEYDRTLAALTATGTCTPTGIEAARETADLLSDLHFRLGEAAGEVAEFADQAAAAAESCHRILEGLNRD